MADDSGRFLDEQLGTMPQQTNLDELMFGKGEYVGVDPEYQKQLDAYYKARKQVRRDALAGIEGNLPAAPVPESLKPPINPIHSGDSQASFLVSEKDQTPYYETVKRTLFAPTANSGYNNSNISMIGFAPTEVPEKQEWSEAKPVADDKPDSVGAPAWLRQQQAQARVGALQPDQQSPGIIERLRSFMYPSWHNDALPVAGFGHGVQVMNDIVEGRPVSLDEVKVGAMDASNAAMTGSLAFPKASNAVGSGGAKLAQSTQSIAQPIVRKTDDLGYYSKLDEVLGQLRPTDSVTSQTLAQRGVKASELEARGVGEALKSGPMKVGELLDQMLPPTKLNEVKYGEQKMSPEQLDRTARNFGYKSAKDAADKRGMTVEQFEAETVANFGLPPESTPKWAPYSLDKGGNPTYRETVLHIPETRVAEIDGRLAQLNAEIDQMSGGMRRDIPSESVPRFKELRAEATALSDERANLKRGNFRSGHWDEPNVMAHMRSSMQKDSQGRPVFHLDELQSDWGQKLRDGGVKDEAKVRALSDSYKSVSDEMGKLNEDASNFRYRYQDFLQQAERDGSLRRQPSPIDQMGALAKHPDPAVAQHAAEMFAKQTDTAQRMRLMQAELDTARAATPGHPLVNTTDQWTTTAIRRALRQAAESGAEGISLTPGKVQNERFDLEKHVSKLLYDPKSGYLTARLHNGRRGETFPNTKPEDLPAIVGKEMAEKLLAQPITNDNAMGAVQSLSGVDLRLGGEGMKFAYDQLYPKLLAKELSKLDPSIKREFQTLAGHEDKGPFAYFPITPKAREEILRGLPLFANPKAAAAAPALEHIAKGLDRSVDPLNYYSHALEVAKGLKQSKGTPDQYLSAMKNAGVKQAEIEATGLNTAFKDRPSITLDEIVNHLEGNRVGVKEALYGDMTPAMKADYDEFNRLADYVSSNGGEKANPQEASRIRDLYQKNDSFKVPHAKWQRHSLDDSNPSYRETVLHLPRSAERMKADRQPLMDEFKALQDKDVRTPSETARMEELRSSLHDYTRRMNEADAQNFQSGHFSEPNIIGHMMTSLNKHEGKPVFTLDQIQSDWGQKLRDGGVRDEAKIAGIRQQIEKLKADADVSYNAATRILSDAGVDYTQFGALDRFVARGDDLAKQVDALRNKHIDSGEKHRLLNAELNTALAGSPGHPLVNTTDQWTNTTLRRALSQAVEQDADYIAIPSGKTVLSYNPGNEHGMEAFYNDIVPKNLSNMLRKLDKSGGQKTVVDTLETPSGMKGKGFTLFQLTPAMKDEIKRGLPLFSNPKSSSAVPALEHIAKGLEGEPIRAYHWSKRPDAIVDDKFNPFSHFGSQEAAAGRYENNVWHNPVKGQPKDLDHGGTFPVDLDIKNPLRIEDFYRHRPEEVAGLIDMAVAGKTPKNVTTADLLQNNGPLLKLVDEAVAKGEDPRSVIAQFLDERGNDGLVYNNKYEGGGDSYIATKPGTVRSATTGELLYSNSKPSAATPALEHIAKGLEEGRTRAYHGTNQNVDRFQLERSGENTLTKDEIPAVWATTGTKQASGYAEGWGATPRDGANVMPLDINTKNFDEWDLGGGRLTADLRRQALSEALADGREGVVFRQALDPHREVAAGGAASRNAPDVIAALKPGNVRSATTGELLFSNSKPSSISPALEHISKSLDADNPRLSAKGLLDQKLGEETGSLRGYHGTYRDVDKFDLEAPGNSSNEVRHIGPWFAKQPEVSNEFAAKIDNWTGEMNPEGGRVIPVDINFKNPKVYETLPPNTSRHGELMAEEKALKAELKDIEANYHKSGGDLKEIWAKQKAIGSRLNQIKDEARPLLKRDAFELMRDDMDQFATYIGGKKGVAPGFWRQGYIHENPKEAAEAYRKWLADQGYDGLVLRNTAYDAQNAPGGLSEQYVPLQRGTVKSATTGDVMFANPKQSSAAAIADREDDDKKKKKK